MSIAIKFATWNVGSLLADLDKNTEALAEAVKDDKPDVLCMQELPSFPKLWDKIKQNGSFQYFYYYETSESHVAEGWNMGIGVFSKYPLSDIIVRELTRPTERIFYGGKEEFWHRKFFLKATLTVNNTELLLFSGHGFPFYRYGLLEEEHDFVYREIDAFVSEYAREGESYIICTDFNAYDAVRFMPFVSVTHRDVFAGIPTRPTGRKTDAIVIPKECEPLLVKNSIVQGMDHNYLSVLLSI